MCVVVNVAKASTIVRNVGFPKSLPNVIILHFSRLVTTKMSKVLEF